MAEIEKDARVVGEIDREGFVAVWDDFIKEHGVPPDHVLVVLVSEACDGASTVVRAPAGHHDCHKFNGVSRAG